MTSSKLRVVFLMSMLFVFSAMIWGQTSTGEVNGTITDPAGAAVPVATIKLINQATKIESQVLPNQNGSFTFVNVRPGSYVLRVESQGFKTVQTSPFDVGVSQSVTQDIALVVGEVNQTVEVSADTELVQRSSTELGTVIAEKAVQDLPLNGRNFTQLLTLTPGVTPVSTSQNRNVGCCEGNVGLPGSGFSDASFHGQQNRSKLYFFDGIINTNVRGPTYIVIPNIDAIQEFKVVGHDAKAEFGGATGGIVNMVSKSGGNSFHGSAFEYVRNNFFDARNAFTDATCTLARCKPGQVVPSGPTPFHQNQFGAVVSGPVIKNKTFFSFSYDGWRYSQAGLGLSYVPTAAEIAGDFSATSSAFRRQIYNPYSTRVSGSTFVRDPFRCDASGNPLPVNAQKQQDQTIGTACNKIPQALIFAPMQKFFQTFAATPNFSDARDLTTNFMQTRPTVNNSNSYQARVDHRFSENDNIFFRYTEHRVSIVTPIGNVGSTGGGSQGRNYGGGWTHTFTPSLILDVRAGYAGRPGVDAGQQNQHPAGLEPLKQAGFVDVDKYSGLLVALSNWSNGGNGNFGIRGAAPRENPNWSVTPNLVWLKGNHNVKTGFWFIEAKRIQLNTFQTYTFNDEQTRNPSAASGTTGLSLASALLGFPNNFQAQLPILHGGPVQFKYGAWAAYGQDEWKLRPNLTLTLGLRYDYLTQPKTLDGRLWNALDLLNQRWIIGAKTMPGLCSVVKQSPCIPDAFQSDPHFGNVVLAGKEFFAPPPVKDNWGPRVGVAWAINPKTVLRAGYGLYWDALPARSQYAQNDLEMTVWPDATAFSGTANTSASFTNGTAANIIQIQSQGFATPLPTTNPWTPANTFGDDPNYKDGYSHQWHLEVQRELSPAMMVTAAYVGSKNGRLPYSGFANTARQASPNGTPNSVIDALRPMPWVGANINYTLSTGYSNYNALQAKFQRRFSAGLSTLVSYTWSKSIDVSSGYFNVENGPAAAGRLTSSVPQGLSFRAALGSVHPTAKAQAAGRDGIRMTGQVPGFALRRELSYVEQRGEQWKDPELFDAAGKLTEARLQAMLGGPCVVRYGEQTVELKAERGQALNQAAREGFRFSHLARGFVQTAFGALVARPAGGAGQGGQAFDYKVLGATRVATMRKELDEAAAAGYELRGVTAEIGVLPFTPSAALAVLERPHERTQPQSEYRLVTANKEATLQREIEVAVSEGLHPVELSVNRDNNAASIVFGLPTFRFDVVLRRDPANPAAGMATREYRFVSTMKAGTLQKEMNQLAQEGYRYHLTAAGAVALMSRELKGAEKGRYEYKAIFARRTGALQKEMSAAGKQGFRFAGLSGLLAIFERDTRGPRTPHDYQLLAATRGKTVQKETAQSVTAGGRILDVAAIGEFVLIVDKTPSAGGANE